jgi:hypothetical protein
MRDEMKVNAKFAQAVREAHSLKSEENVDV